MEKEIATLGGGCFWCVEFDLRQVAGVLDCTCGYMGGPTQNPSYETVCSGRTGHAEVVAVTFDPTILSYHDLLMRFMTLSHDPSQMNRQGVDIGTQYRSVIFTHSDAQAATAKNIIETLKAKGPVATEIKPAETFWPAEDYHQNYYAHYAAAHGRPHVRVLAKAAKYRT